MKYRLQLVFNAGWSRHKPQTVQVIDIFLYRVQQTDRGRVEGGGEVMILQSLSITEHSNGKIGIIFGLIYRSTWENCFQF